MSKTGRFDHLDLAPGERRILGNGDIRAAKATPAFLAGATYQSIHTQEILARYLTSGTGPEVAQAIMDGTEP